MKNKFITMKTINNTFYSILLVSSFLVGCDDMFDPAIENIVNESSLYGEPAVAEGLLVHGYLRVPNSHDYVFDFNSVATDDAVSNDFNNGYLRMANGQWTSTFNPVSVWDQCYNGILYLNKILKEGDRVAWAEDEEASTLFNMRIKGEAYALRGYLMYFLLQAHAGYSNGQLLGVPIVTQSAEDVADYNMPRAEFRTCIDSLLSDLDRAEALLPVDYNDINVDSGVIPQKYVDVGVTSQSAYNRVLGLRFRGRMTGRIVKFMRGKATLLAASQAFMNGANGSWERAAQAAADLLEENNGLSGLDMNGWKWYQNLNEIEAIQDGSVPPEMVWRHRTLRHSGVDGNVEKQLWPPTLFGLGRVNPSQNLVDAFPMVNGYPIDAAGGNYDENDPYANRDPRMNAYIIHNGSVVGPSNEVISMTTTRNAVDATENSTRTGYYVRKLTKDPTNLDPSNPSSALFYKARMRYTEMYLNYAEAANEAYGPTGTAPGVTYSAYDVIRAIRERAGVGGSSDPYLMSMSGGKDTMRKMIQNERRLELCFEGHRFWDVRRWKLPLAKLNEPIRGIKSTDGNGDPIYDFTGPYVLPAETRAYKDYMYYGPIPYGESIKFTNLSQNDGWQ